MGRPKKEQEQPETEVQPEAEKPKVPTARENMAKQAAEKKAALQAEFDALAKKLQDTSKSYLASDAAPVFVPYKDRDGKIVPALVLGLSLTEKRDPHTNELILSPGREVQQEYRASVWVFSNASEPHRAVYSFPNK
jgi:hypothetical protein